MLADTDYEFYTIKARITHVNKNAKKNNFLPLVVTQNLCKIEEYTIFYLEIVFPFNYNK